MHDYQLERLNTRSFEQLVQSLAIEILGNQVSVFGDGPDGGREATFSGSITYPQGPNGWNGYGVVQAKFKQQPDTRAQKNADWALAELKAEFKKMKPKPKRSSAKPKINKDRVCPDYYIFATNLTLSATANTGGKDRVTSFLESCKSTYGLKDYAVWDGDQIRRMLDTKKDIRTSFLPFVLPGDVLALMMDSLSLKRTDFAATMLRHLQLELLDDQFAKLSQGGYTNASRVSLSNVFVDLPVNGKIRNSDNSSNDSSTVIRNTILQNIFSEASCVLRPSYLSHASVAFEQSQAPIKGRFVLVGGPGQGKTTAGVFACQVMRAALLQEAGTKYHTDVQQALTDVLHQAASLPKISTLRYPLRVDLKKLAEALNQENGAHASTLLEFLSKQIEKRTGTTLNIEDFRIWLHNYPWLLVLDGLDEVPPSSNRSLMMEAINDFVRVEVHQADADLLIIATTRPQGYSEEFDSNNYLHLKLLPLLPDEALHYGARLAQARHTGATTHIDELIQILGLATKNPATARLMESPLQVTIMLSLIELGGHPPEQRWQLFQQYYDTIFKREKERNTPFSKMLRDYETDIHWIHHRAGWILQQRNAESGTTAARLSHKEFESIVRNRLTNKGHTEGIELSRLVAQMREAATDRLVLLVGNTAQDIGFEIRSLQEFMAAEHVFDGDDQCIRNTLKIIAPYAYWQNVFLFMAGRIFFRQESLVDSLISICDYLNEPLNDLSHASTKAGSRLALAMLADDACRKQPANTRRLARLAANLMDHPLHDDRKSLSQQFRRESQTVLKEELGKRLTGNSFYYGAWTICLDLAKEGEAWATQLFNDNFPWKHAELEDFLIHHTIATENNDPGDFFWDKLVYQLRYIGIRFLDHAYRFGDLRQLEKRIDPKIASAIKSLLRRKEIKLTTTDGKDFHNSYRDPFDISCYRDLQMQNEDFSSAHPDWRALACACNFARKPTIENLCSQLKILINGKDTPRLLHTLPWQLNIFLPESNAGIEIDEIIKSVKSKCIGTPSDWLRWETIHRLSIYELTEPPPPLKVANQAYGAAFATSGWSHGHTGIIEEINFLNELGDALPRLKPKSKISESLIFLACFGLNRVATNISTSNIYDITKFIDTAKTHDHAIGRELISAILMAETPNEHKLTILKSISECKFLSSYWILGGTDKDNSFKNFWPDIYKYALEHDSDIDILPALALLPPTDHLSHVEKSTIQRAVRAGGAYKIAATMINIGAAKWPMEDANKIATEILEILKTEVGWVNDWADYVDAQGLHGAHIEDVLSILKNTTTTPSMTKRFSHLLSKVVARRAAPTSLLDPSQLGASI